jgi:ATP-dependent Clp protease ATP-binding subunit ClpA
MREVILQGIRDHFNFALGRPEILNRFGDNFVVFDFIRPPIDEEIVDLLLKRLISSAREEQKIPLVIDQPVRQALIGLARQNLQHGGRGIRNVIDAALVNPLNRLLFERGAQAEGLSMHLTDLIDHGPEAPHRFEVLASA